ncbi:MAG TPA: putative toxin-antitoxin system toxin component, PIN family [Thermoanaerobaculia bacterium]|nr:putative toxin-antitoxin system toxin component, PIN family [Thermoanaerobaculia bacterium]
MKVVFDTNVYVSALVFPGSRAEVALQRIIEGADELLLSRPILAELLDVLARKFSRNAEELSRVALFLDDLGRIVETTTMVNQLADEPDNRVLECAIDGGADCIVTGDKRMLELKTWRGVRCSSLADYLSR